jgi:hypothetical protein
MPAQHRMLFTDPINKLESEIKTIIKEKNQNDLIFLISHSGMEYDQRIAQNFPQIDWIIGAHSMSYNTIPISEGNTQITQVLSRNHYLGKISIPFGSNKNLKYSILESREETQDLITPNPMKQFLDEHKQKLLDIQTIEQKQMMTNSGDIDFIPTANSCLECHEKQTKFWEKTSHSFAYATLYKNNAHMNSQCIECHSVGFQKEGGFQRPMDFAYHDKKPIESKVYTQELGRIFAGINSVRGASSEKIVEVRKSWDKLDNKFKVDHNFANVQCLNCHEQAAGHPFTVEEKKVVNYQHKCIQCHTQDQSPDWYEKASTKINQKTFNQNLKKVACPKGKAQL